MVNHAEIRMGSILRIGVKRQIHRPRMVDRHRSRWLGFKLTAQLQDLQTVFFNQLCHKRLAHRHAIPIAMQPIKADHDFAA